MPGDGVQPRTLRKFALDIGHQRRGSVSWRRKTRLLAEEKGIDGEEPPGLLIGGTAHHDTVQAIKVCARNFERTDAAVENDGQARMRGFQPVDACIIEWRHLAVLSRRQA